MVYRYLYINYDFKIECPIHKITHLYCPGCGVTRMLFAILKLDFYQAFRYNPLLFIFLPFISICIIDYLVGFIRNKDTIIYKRINNKIWFSLVIIFLLFGIIRNIPKFNYLAPTEIHKETLKN
ncbi:MAG: DUF2752 domain-containing protein [Bacilli bacterium]|nr:DUF2752 domain-containing protein [Bacilli bacterium]